MVKGEAFVEEGLRRYEEKILENKERLLRKLAKQLGKVVVSETRNASILDTMA